MKGITLFIFSVLFLCCIEKLETLQVKLFTDLNFKGLIYDYMPNGTESCHNVKEYAQGAAGSLKTDTCLIIYEEPDCSGNSYKLSRDMTDELANLRRPVFSFHKCTAEYGGNTIRVDMYSGANLIGEYKDICGCQDLPSQVSTRLEKLNNYGNCITVYSSSTCSGNSTEIPAGRNGLTQNLPSIGYYVRSVSACGKRRACVRLKSDIFKVVFISDPEGERILNTGSKSVDLATKTKFFNNGSATVFQEYEARKKIRESTTVGLVSTITAMATSNVSESLQTVTSYGPGFNIGVAKHTTKITDSVKETYKTETTSASEDRQSHTHETENEFAVKQVIELPPCSEYEITSTVEIVENIPLFYELYTKVTGESSGRRMTADEISTQVDEMTFVELIDEYTAVYKTSQSLVANIGVDTKISGEGKPIPGCGTREA